MKPTNTLQYKNYTCQVTYYNVKDCLVGKVLGMSQIRTFNAQSIADIKAAFHNAVDDYLLACAESGKEPAQAFPGSFTVRTTPAIHEALTLYAAEQGTMLSQVTQTALFEFLGNHDIQVGSGEG